MKPEVDDEWLILSEDRDKKHIITITDVFEDGVGGLIDDKVFGELPYYVEIYDPEWEEVAIQKLR